MKRHIPLVLLLAVVLCLSDPTCRLYRRLPQWKPRRRQQKARNLPK